MNTLTQIGEHFRANLSSARTFRERKKTALTHKEKVHVVGAGATLTAAYEQLRNAAENTEEHLLLQNAIRRYFRQVLLTRDRKFLDASGEELAIELTLAGYIANDSLTTSQVGSINSTAAAYGKLYDGLRDKKISADQALSWMLDMLSVAVEREVSDRTDDDVFMQFCFEYFSETIKAKHVFPDKVPTDYELALFMAVHRSLLKSDNAVIRADIMRRHQIPADDIQGFIKLNRHIDKLLNSAVTERLFRLVDRQAAPERIIRRMLNEGVDVRKLLEQKTKFMTAYSVQIEREYSQVKKRIRKAIIRSIIFLFITKILIGLAIEVPYDLAVHGSIIWLPLIVNLFFPPVYMALLSLTLVLPGPANAQALSERITAVLYTTDATVELHRSGSAKSGSKAFSIGYAIFGVVLIALISWGLFNIGFSMLHLLIFFIFLSTASFLGFRLSRMVRELEVGSSEQSSLTFIRDMLYLPFVVIGRWLSDRYARLNIITLALDMIIELPLKTVLRLVRQWTIFINAKKDEL